MRVISSQIQITKFCLLYLFYLQSCSLIFKSIGLDIMGVEEVNQNLLWRLI